MTFTIRRFAQRFSVCKVQDASEIDLTEPFCFAAKTDEETSLVCPTDRAPQNALAREDGWRMLRVEGPLDFSLVGILAGLSTALAREKIGIFAVSTYNTDYIFVKDEKYERALACLRAEGHSIIE